ncbi:MAG: DUF3592 domain-containing protein [Planctomycetes bacterium]|nr:DUF3592 domain-containing protein [Planctomycetota bacterium]
MVTLTAHLKDSPMWWRLISPLSWYGWPQSPARLYITGAFVSFLGGVLLLFGGCEVRRVAQTRAWPSTMGTLDVSKVQDITENQDHPVFRLRVAYHFELAGQQFHGDRLTPLGAPNDSEQEAAARAMAHPSGQPCAIFYDPKDPKVNCLEPGATGKAWTWVWLGLAMLVLGAIPIASLMFIPAPKE